MVSELKTTRAYSRYTVELHQWLPSYLEVTESAGQTRFKRLLEFFDLNSPGGRLVLEAVQRFVDKTTNQCANSFMDPTESNRVSGLVEAKARWEAVKNALYESLPAENKLAPETQLVNMKRDPSENLLEFVMRFRRLAEEFRNADKVSDDRALQILYQKLPPDMQRSMTTMNFSTSTLNDVEAVVRNRLDWMAVSTPGTYNRRELGDYMEIGALDMDDTNSQTFELNAIREKLFVNGNICFNHIVNENAVMVVWKELMKRPKYRREAERFLASSRNTRKSSNGGPSQPSYLVHELVESEGEDDNLPSSSHLQTKDMVPPMEDQSLHNCQLSLSRPRGDVEQESHPAIMVCNNVKSKEKPSMHLSVKLAGHKISALVDTGAINCFIQSSMVASLQLQHRVQPCSNLVIMGNGLAEELLGRMDLRVSIDGQDYPLEAFVIQGKGPPLILGYRFLSDHNLTVDCRHKRVYRNDGSMLQCHSLDPTRTLIDKDALTNDIKELKAKVEALTTQVPKHMTPKMSLCIVQSNVSYLEFADGELVPIDARKTAHMPRLLGSLRTTGRCIDYKVREIPFKHPLPRQQMPYASASGPSEEAKLLTEIQKLLDLGVLEEVSKEPYLIPVFAIPKKTGDVKLVLDFRKFNACVEFQPFLPVHREHSVAQIRPFVVGSTLDLSNAYFQIPLAKKLQRYFGISVFGRFFQYRRLPFGYHNSPCEFLRGLQPVLVRIRRSISSQLVAYMDDILLLSSSIEAHSRDLCVVFHYLQESGWRLRPDKCTFFATSFPFLDHVVSTRGWEPQSSSIDRFVSLSPPTTQQGWRSVKGWFQQLIRFVYNGIKVQSELRRAEETKSKVDWDCFVNGLMSHMVRCTHPLPKASYGVAVDASQTGWGHVYCNMIKPWLFGLEVIVYTDNSSVQSLANVENHSDFVKRRLDQVQDICPQFRFLPGRSNVVPDYLSRQNELLLVQDSTCVSLSLDQGYETTLQNLLMMYPRWKNMESHVRRYIDQCPNCAFNGASQIRDLPSVEVSRSPGEKLSIDHTGPFFDGSYLFVTIDDATKWLEVRQTRDTSAREAIEALEHWRARWGRIKLICSDNASAWNSDEFRTWAAKRKIDLRRTSSYHHRGNGGVERVIQTLTSRMRRMLNGSCTKWPEVIQGSVDAINTSWSSVTLTTPTALMKGLNAHGVMMSDDEIKEAWMPEHRVRSFSGLPDEDAISWLCHFKRVARINGWKTDSDKLWNIGVTFEGPSEIWYSDIEEWSLNASQTWKEFEDAFIERFKPPNYDELTENALRTISQDEDEDVATYGSRFSILHGRLTNGVSVDLFLFHWIRGLKSKQWQQDVLRSKPKTFKDALEEARELENIQRTMDATENTQFPMLSCATKNRYATSRAIDTDVGQLSDAFLQLMELASKSRGSQISKSTSHKLTSNQHDMTSKTFPVFQRPRRVPRCFNCGEEGHTAWKYPKSNMTKENSHKDSNEKKTSDAFATLPHKHAKKRTRKGHSDLGEGTKTRRPRAKNTKKRQIKLTSKEVGGSEYSIQKELNRASAGITFGQLLNLVPSMRKEVKSGLAMQPSRTTFEEAMDELKQEGDPKAREYAQKYEGRTHANVERSDILPSQEQSSSKMPVDQDVNLANLDQSEQSLKVEARINDHLLKNVIIDAGSMMNVMKMADGRKKNAIGSFEANVNVAGVKQTIPIHVIDAKSTFDMVLGKPWLRKVNGISDWGKDEHYIKDKHGKTFQLTPYESSSEESYIDTESSSGSDTSESDNESTKDVVVYSMTKVESGENKKFADFDINEELPEDKQEQMLELLEAYADVFARNLTELKQTDVVERVVKMLPNEGPVCCKKLRRFSPEERQACYDQLVELEAAGFITQDTGPFGANALFVKKKSNELRMCINYAPLNAKTVKSEYPIPLLEECCETLSGSSYYTTLDGFRGYYCIKMENSSIEKTAFFTPYGKFAWKVMPFGLQQAPSIYARLQQVVLGDLMAKNNDEKCVVNFFDDTGVGTKHWIDHLRLLSEVFDAMRLQKLSLNPKKCRFGYFTASFLGFVLTKDGMKPDPNKVASLKQWPRPTTKKQLLSFLGLVGFYRKMIRSFSTISFPLTELLKKSKKFVWDNEKEQSFNTLKNSLSNETLITKPRYDRVWHLSVDASGEGVGGVLSQFDDQGVKRPVYFLSRKLTKPEQNYSVVERELLGLVVCLKKLKHYFKGNKIIVESDHKPLLWLVKQDDLSGKLSRWATIISEFDIEMRYISGTKNVVADGLSRLKNSKEKSFSDDELDCLYLDPKWSDWPAHIAKYLITGSWPSDLSKQECKRLAKRLQQFHIINGELYKRQKDGDSIRYLGDHKERQLLIKWAHKFGHFKLEKTVSRIMKRGWWPSIFTDTKEFISHCDTCQRFEPKKSEAILGELVVISPFEILALDYIGPLPRSKGGHLYILCAVDLYSRWLEAVSTKRSDGSTLIKFMKEIIFPRFGRPKLVLSDRAQCFVGKEFTGFLQISEIGQITSASFSPKSNGCVERYNKTLVEVIRSLVTRSDEWHLKLNEALFSIRSTPHSVLRMSPAQMLMGFSPNETKPSSIESVRDIQLQSAVNDANLIIPDADYIYSRLGELEESRISAEFRSSNNKTQNRIFRSGNRSEKKFRIGDFVLVYDSVRKGRKGSKFDIHWKGPYEIIKNLGEKIWELKDSNGKMISFIHSDKMKIYSFPLD
eukprot:g111.t1